VLQVSLDCPFLIAPSVFSNIYLHLKEGQFQFTSLLRLCYLPVSNLFIFYYLFFYPNDCLLAYNFIQV